MIYGCCRISTSKQNIERQERNILAVYLKAKIFKEIYIIAPDNDKPSTDFKRELWGRLTTEEKMQNCNNIFFVKFLNNILLVKSLLPPPLKTEGVRKRFEDVVIYYNYLTIMRILLPLSCCACPVPIH